MGAVEGSLFLFLLLFELLLKIEVLYFYEEEGKTFAFLSVVLWFVLQDDVRDVSEGKFVVGNARLDLLGEVLEQVVITEEFALLSVNPTTDLANCQVFAVPLL